MKQVEEYFKNYTGSNYCYTTSDGLVFHEQGDARLHANSLEDKEVEQHKRKSATLPKEEDLQDNNATEAVEAEKPKRRKIN